MGRRKHIPAKVVSPRTAKIIHRSRLFDLIDEAREASSEIWVAAPGGSGKTTLMSSYLEKQKVAHCWYQVDEDDHDIATFFHYLGIAAKLAAPRRKKSAPKFSPECQGGIVAFTRHFFTDISSRLNSDGLIVLDNYQLLPDANPLSSLIPCIADSLSKGVSLVIVSRYLPSAALSELIAKRQLYVIDAQQMRFHENEWLQASQLLQTKHPEEKLKSLYQKLDGWISGLILLPKAEVLDEATNTSRLGIEFLDSYVAEQFLSSLDRETSELLMRACYLPHITQESAKAVSNITNANRLLSELARKNLFVLRQGSKGYTVHPLVQDYLKNRARAVLSAQDIKRLRFISAKALLEEGDYEPAADLLCDLQEWNLLATVILQYAADLFDSGRIAPLKRFIDALPEHYHSDRPWLVYWEGKLATYHNAARALDYFEDAFNKFADSSDAKGSYFSWYSAVSLICSTLSEGERLTAWLRRYDELENKFHNPPEEMDQALIDSTLLHGYLFSGQDPTKRERLRTRQLSVLNSLPSSPKRLQLISHYAIVAAASGIKFEDKSVLSSFEVELSELRDDPVAYLSATIYFSICLWAFSDYKKQMELINAALIIAEESGVSVFDSHLLSHKVIAALGLNDLDSATTYMTKLKAALPEGDQIRDSLLYTCLIVAGTSFDEYSSEVAGIAENYLASIESTCIAPFIVHHKLLYIYCLCERGEISLAMSFHDALLDFCERVSFPGQTARFYFIYAKIFYDRGETDVSNSYLKNGLAIARHANVVTCCHWPPKLLSWVCDRATTLAIEPEFVVKFIEEHFDKLTMPMKHTQNWPHPFRLYTLGRFEVKTKNGASIFNQRAGKSMAMLKALAVAVGNRLTSTALCEALYSDVEPNKVAPLLDTQIHRLRKLFGSDQVIVRDGDTVALNHKYFWVDAFEIESLGKSVITEENALAVSGRLLELYQGEYLPNDESFEVMAQREKIRNIFLATALECIEQLRESPHVVVDICQDALTLEPLSEPLYRRLITTYLSQGNRDMAEITLARCRAMIRRYLNCEVSTATSSLLG